MLRSLCVTLYTRLHVELFRTRKFDLVERKRLGEVIDEQCFNLSDFCNDEECAAEIGQCMKVDLVVTGTLSRAEGVLTLSAGLVDVWAVQYTRMSLEDCECDVGSYVSLGYSLDAGATWIEINDYTSNDRSYTWHLPDLGTTESDCLVRVSSTSTSFSDTSNATFTIHVGR